jgi:carboxyl-terminal processing protease
MLAVLIMSAAGVLNLTGLTGITAGKYAALEKKIINKVNLLEVYIDEYFLDDIDEEKMADSVYKGVIDGLGDDYAAYYTAEEYQDIQEKTEGIYCGIGAYLSADTQSGAITVVKPMKNSPAEKAGVKAGDIIYAVDGKEVSNMEISQVQALVKGEQGSEVKLTLLRKEKKVEVTVTRDEIVEDTVSSKLLDGKIGYIQVTSFEKVTAKQFRAAIKKLEKKGEEGLIIDLRNNGGGLLDTAVDMLDRMLPEGVVVYSKDKSGKKQEYKAEDPDKFDKPLVILVNGNSASASEVFCGAIQDEKAGVLLGTTTFGKGIVQGVFSLDDGSAVKMTTAKYYTPKGRNIHGKGLTPDVEVELTDEEETLPVSGKKVDNQLKAAYDYLTQK